MAMTKPRLAVGYHFQNDHDPLPAVLEAVRTTRDGSVALATDYMVISVTRNETRVRMAAVDQDIWPLPPTRPKFVKKERQLSGSVANSSARCGDRIAMAPREP